MVRLHKKLWILNFVCQHIKISVNGNLNHVVEKRAVKVSEVFMVRC